MTNDIPYNECNFYVQAHQDDWQLFNAHNGWHDINNALSKTIFIYTTAGDEGRTDGWWESRERGAMESVRNAIWPLQPVTQNIILCNGHPILRYSSRNTRSYFLRLPGKTSICYLKELYNGTALQAVDYSTSYTDWADFVNTLQSIIKTESVALPAGSKACINVASSDSTNNPNDNPDHTQTSLAVQQAVQPINSSNNYRFIEYKTYCTSSLPGNIEEKDYKALKYKKAAYDAYKITFLNEIVKNGASRLPLEIECEGDWNNWGDKYYPV